MNKFEELYKKIQNKLNEEKVIDNGDEISARTANIALSYGVSPFNNCFIREEKKLVKQMNKKIKRANLFHNDIPYVLDLCPGINEEGNRFIDVLLTDYDNRVKGKACINEELNIIFDFIREGYSEERLKNVLSQYTDIYKTYMSMLDIFKEYYPNAVYTWNVGSSVGKETVSDGFVAANLYLEDPDGSNVSFDNLDDTVTATTHSKYGKLYDYLGYCKYSFMERIKVNINDLNPLFQTIIRKQLELNNGFKKEKKL